MKNFSDHRINSQTIKSEKNCFIRIHSFFQLLLFFIVIISGSFCKSSTGKQRSEDNSKGFSFKTDSSIYSDSVNNKSNVIMSTQSNKFPYDLNNPDEEYLLPKNLKEISGLSYYKEDKILCIQDEKANIYVFDLVRKEIENKYNFGIDGDYEDVAIVGQTAYVIRSDGNIFEIVNFDKETRKVIEHKTPLSQKNDSEGLTFDKFSNSLFIACKGSPSVDNGNPYKGYKAVYQFDLREMKLDKKPKFIVDLNRPESYKDDNLYKNLILMNSTNSPLTESKISFRPSGLAIHPVSNEIYLMASIGKILIIMDRNGKVLNFHILKTELFLQPEGICFSPSGDLFISSEGKGGNGYILKFNYRITE